ncbi:MAG: exodeoxyribonuclease VII large subunit [Armatimonadetes bacterium]|nr:exodeoxyribonuclease VII large subunit [Armatimonadota bacterium]
MFNHNSALEINYLTVTQLNYYLKNLIETDNFLQALYLKGEISNFSRSALGHYYFVLKDQQSRINCVMFNNQNSILKFNLENGMKVLASGQISIYEKHGQYQLKVLELKPEGLGELYLAYLQLKEKLAKEGLFDAKYKKKIPFLPLRIGVITSLYGAALYDIITTLKKRNSAVKIIVCEAQVQGEEAPLSIVKAIENLNRYQELDLIIAGRGGGSFEELSAFNDERVARAIFASHIPIISAVGHEIDFTIADLAADLRAPTPTAGAELALPVKEELLKHLNILRERAKLALKNKLDNEKRYLKLIQNKGILKDPYLLVQNLSLDLDNLIKELKFLINKNITEYTNKLSYLLNHLKALSPLNILNRGYALALKLPQEKIIKSIEELKEKDLLKILLKDGKVICEIKELMK